VPWDVIGHEWLVATLQRDLARGRVHHAYLFAGPSGIGKRTLAGAFARALLCPNADPPCGQCRHCTLTARGSHPDLLTIEPVRRTRQSLINVETIRNLNYDLTLKPVEAKRRVARLHNFHAANDQAMNAFLKTLEEPPGETVILLTAERADDLLPTIVSRCQVFTLRPLPLDTVRDALITRWMAAADKADFLAHLAGGRLGWAVRMLTDEAALDTRAQHLDELTRLVSGTRVERFAYAERLAKQGMEPIEKTIDVWLSYWRDVLLTAAGANAPLANPDRESDIRRLAGALDPMQAQAVVTGLRRTSELLAKNANTRLTLEVCLLDWPRVSPVN
jgi:DNA polymerase-3 subunit delta'